MPSAQPLRRTSRVPNLWAAWLVHIYTASGALCAFFGTLAVFSSRYRDAFLLMVLATFLDATDGVLARAAAVKEVLPRFDGARLDDIVDYLTFVSCRLCSCINPERFRGDGEGSSWRACC